MQKAHGNLTDAALVADGARRYAASEGAQQQCQALWDAVVEEDAARMRLVGPLGRLWLGLLRGFEYRRRVRRSAPSSASLWFAAPGRNEAERR